MDFDRLHMEEAWVGAVGVELAWRRSSSVSKASCLLLWKSNQKSQNFVLVELDQMDQRNVLC